jgi:hypothetical protein
MLASAVCADLVLDLPPPPCLCFSLQWCGDMAAKVLEPFGNPPVIMCNGDSASNTINTCNSNDCSGFLESHGQSGRILVDQPGL